MGIRKNLKRDFMLIEEPVVIPVMGVTVALPVFQLPAIIRD